jgi:enoyl-CoA hydratase/carnithine racemase
VTEVAADGAGLDRALELAERLAALPPVAVAVTKQVIDAMPDASYDAGLALERLGYAALAQTAEHAEATAAFTRKR